jgi:hypothetical protein
MKYNYIYDIQNYTSFDKLQELTDICRSELKLIDWKQFVIDIQLTEKEIDVLGPSWRYGTGNASQLVECVESNTVGTVAPPTSELGTYMWFVLFPTGGDYVNYRINSLVRTLFPKTLTAINNLSGLQHANMNVISPKFRVPKHIDDPSGNVLTVIVTFKISKTTPELAILNIAGTDHSMKDREYFVFDSKLEHYGDNSSDDDWIALALQITNTEFK